MIKQKLSGPPLIAFLSLNPFNRDKYLNLDYLLNLTKTHGEIFKVTKQIILTGPQGFEHVLKTNRNNYNKHHRFYRRVEAFFGKSLLVTEHEQWKQRRKIANPSFHPDRIKAYAPIITRSTLELANEWNSNQGSHKNSIEILSAMSMLTLKIALEIFTGEKETLSKSELRKLRKSIAICNYNINHSLHISPWICTPGNLRFYWNKHILDSIILEIIRNKRQSKRQKGISSNNVLSDNTLLDHLISGTYDSESGTRPMNDEEILAEFKTLLVTGHETTASGLAWMWYLLAEHPEYQIKLFEELEQNLGERTATLEDLEHLPWLKAIVNETFRLYPPIWTVMRKSVEEDEICGYRIPSGSNLLLSLYALHRNPDYWDCPNLFYPPRFFLENSKDRHPFAFLPFIAGARTCIASHLAIIEAQLIAATLAQQFRFEKVNNKEVLPETCVSLRPRGGIFLRALSKQKR